MSEILTVTTGCMRIDQYLTSNYSYSRSFWEHIIKRGSVKILNAVGAARVVKKSTTIHPGDQIIIDDVRRFIDGGVLAEAPAIPLDIRHERDDYLVIYKPKGVLSHPNSVRDISHPSVVGALYHHYAALPSMANFIRAGLLHRLDKDTDGLMLIAKTEAGLAYFKSLFQQKSGADTVKDKEKVPLHKMYRAICDTTLDGTRFLQSLTTFPHILQGWIEPKVPHPGDPKRGITKILSVTVLDTDRVQLDLEILTGRTHQIRYQLSEVGLPISGDYLYHPTYNESMGPMALTAYRLEFEDIDGLQISVFVD